MNYISTKNPDEVVSFEQAVLKGLAQNKGLFMPENIPTLPQDFFDNIETYSEHEIALKALTPFTHSSIDETALKQIIAETVSFPLPVVPIKDNIYSLELFHGPTHAFKDVGARFMSRCLKHFMQQEGEKKATILVATSGDTGSAVANGFYKVAGVDVCILFPKGKVSAYQEYQMSSLGENIQAIEVDGTFDDCQALVKEAFSDATLQEKLNLSSANSINIARLLPQMLYYFFAYKALKAQQKKIVFSVPSGNLGNLTAGIIAHKMGLPARFIAATNSNDTFYQYLQTGDYSPKPSVQTYSNAMDVGAPSNFERLMHLYNHQLEAVRTIIQSTTVGNEATVAQIKKIYEETGYILDPHGAVGMLSFETLLEEDEIGVVLETAHPKKFDQVVQQAVPNYSNDEVDLSNCEKVCIANDYQVFRELLLG